MAALTAGYNPLSRAVLSIYFSEDFLRSARKADATSNLMVTSMANGDLLFALEVSWVHEVPDFLF